MTFNNKKEFYLNQYLYGGISGMCGVLISHPLDTVKTHIQTGNTLSTFKPSIRNLYKGLSIPIIGVGIEKAIVFGTYNYALQNTGNIPLSGAIAGLTASIIVSPYERLKILKQSSHNISLKESLNLKFLFRGLSATFTREVPGFAIYFTVYENLKYYNSKQDSNTKITSIQSFMFGGIAGLVSWIFIFPQDKIKTIIQSSTHINYNRIGFATVISDIYTNKGIRSVGKSFYKGFSWAAGRAILLHSGTFATMDWLSNKKNYKENY